MRLDRTRIAIVERRQTEILDLSFLVLRDFFVPVVGYVSLLAAPLAIMNYLLIRSMAADLIEPATVFRYLWTMGMLVYVEAPFVGIFATAYLGKVTFYESPTVRALLHEVRSVAHRIVWTQLVLRGVLVFIALVASVAQQDKATPIEYSILPGICGVLFLWRSVRPYINEIVLLEKNPIWSKSERQITIRKRSGRLHSSGDLFGRGLAMLLVTVSLGLAIFGLIWFIVATFANDWTWGPVIVHVAIPCVFWMLVVYVTVFRFLSYLDLRIRSEGWEVELKMRAEANRLMERTYFEDQATR